MAKRVLIVDDVPLMRRQIRSALSAHGFEIMGESADGYDGILQYVENKPDVVVLDIVMPGMDGIETLERLLRIDPRARVVMCSALGEKEMIRRAILLGARDFIVKPFAKERIVSAVGKAVDSVGPSSAGA
jgi:two-component system chemotaxis response regulator CheY